MFVIAFFLNPPHLSLSWVDKWMLRVRCTHIVARYALQLAWNTCAFQGRSLPSLRFPPDLNQSFFPTSPKTCFSSPRETCSLFQWEREMFLVFSFQSHVVHLHSAICNAAKQIGVVAVYQIGEINNLIRFLIAKGVKMSRKHHRHVHLIEFGHQSLLQMIRAVPLL